jgi:hypothetical protein
MKSDWINKYFLPEDFSIFFWNDITDKEKNHILSLEGKENWYSKNLNPFKLNQEMSVENSLGLKYKENIVGWIIVEKMSIKDLNYSKLFICGEFQNMGRIIVLLSESIKIQSKLKIPYGYFSFDIRNKNMRLFYEKRFKPYINLKSERYYSYKKIRE